MQFVKFPHTPHLIWLGNAPPRDDKVMSPDEAQDFLSSPVIVEEKVDGANIGISVSEHDEIVVQARGTQLRRGEGHPQFRPLFGWLESRRWRLIERLDKGLILFGEWCYAKHSIRYTKLPDWFLAFDVYDRTEAKFWTVERRDALVRELQLEKVPIVTSGKLDTAELLRLIQRSAYADAPMEGLYLRSETALFLDRRAKIVRTEFHQSIGDHWSGRRLETNLLVGGRH